MNLSKLFEMQKVLDERIVHEKGLQGRDMLPEKILALQVELGECANEWRGFKFWSEDMNPRVKSAVSTSGENADYFLCEMCDGEYDHEEAKEVDYSCDLDMNKLIGVKRKNPLLEEYVDCLHFILSIGLERGLESKSHNLSAAEGLKQSSITAQFSYLFTKIGDFNFIRNHNNYMYIIPLFFGLGEMLGFTWEEIESAYMDKNTINHNRQNNGY